MKYLILKSSIIALFVSFIYTNTNAQKIQECKLKSGTVTMKLPIDYGYYPQPDETTEHVWFNEDQMVSIGVVETMMDFKVEEKLLLSLLSSHTLRDNLEKKMATILKEPKVLSYHVDKYMHERICARMVMEGDGLHLGVEGKVIYVGYITYVNNYVFIMECMMMGETGTERYRLENFKEIGEIMSSIRYKSTE